MKKEVTSEKKSAFTVRELTFSAVFTALIAVCSWISIPLTVPITLQTFAVFAAIAFLGTKCSTASIAVYILLGAVGVPVFAGFKGGLSALFGTTGGYIVGFIFCPIIVALITKLFGNWGEKLVVRFLAMAVALVVLYAFGTAWFILVYTRSTGAVTLVQALKWCVTPFVIFDLIKIALALILENRVGKLVNIRPKAVKEEA